MIDRFKILRLLSSVFAVLAWLAVAWAIFALFTADIDDVFRTGMYGAKVFEKKGIGFMGGLAIFVDGGIRFVAFLGASQAIKLWLQLDAAMSGLSMRLGDITGAITELKMQQVKTIEQVRMVGSIVYEEAKKDD